MARDGYGDDFDIVDADGSWNQHDSYAVRRAPQQNAIHMSQQVTTKIAPAYDGRSSFFAFEDAVDGWCDITELEPEKRGPVLRSRGLLRDPNDGVSYSKRFLRPHQGSPGIVLVPIHAVHGTQ